MTNSITPTWEPRIVLQMLVASDVAAQPRGIMDCVDNDGKPYQSAHMAKLVEHARALVTAPTAIGERQAIAEGEAVITSAGLTVDVDEGGDATILWPDGRWLDATPSGLITVGQSPSVRPARQYELDRLAATPATNAPVAAQNVASYAEYQQRRGRLPDLIEDAISIFDEWMKDDNYDARRCLDNVIAKLMTARDWYAAPQTTVPIHGEMREALERIAKTKIGLQGVLEDYGHDTNAYNYHASQYWQELATRYQQIAAAALATIRARNALQGDGL